jgi:hypothetical protein
MIAPDVGLREFSFDGVFPERASQKTLYDTGKHHPSYPSPQPFNPIPSPLYPIPPLLDSILLPKSITYPYTLINFLMN